MMWSDKDKGKWESEGVKESNWCGVIEIHRGSEEEMVVMIK